MSEDTPESVIDYHDSWKPFLASDGINQGMPFVVYPDEMNLLIAEYDALKARVEELEQRLYAPTGGRSDE